MGTAPPTDRDGRFGAVDGLRAIAALAVLAHHAGFDTGATYTSRIGDYLARGDVGVPIFFCLSGFLLYRPFARAIRDGAAAPDARRFWWRRAARIFPAYWVALAVLSIGFGVSLGHGVDPIRFALLTQIYSGRLALRGLPQAWSLCVEISFYALLPAIAAATARLAARYGVARAQAVTLVGLVSISWLWKFVLYTWSPAWKHTALFWLPAYLDVFALGMALAVASLQPPSRLRRAAQHTTWWWIVAAVAFWALAERLHLPKGVIAASGHRAAGRDALHLVIAGALLTPLVIGGGRGRIGDVLRWAPVAWLGSVSYGVYLWHKTFVTKATQWTGGDPFDPNGPHGHFTRTVVVALAVTLVAAALSHRLVEEPLSRRAAKAFPTPRTAAH
jgi:peptidoglycan/LPS O-acetylase OafA/YrhL